MKGNCSGTLYVIGYFHRWVTWNVFDDKSIIEHYAVAGIQVMPINTLFQLYGMQRNGDSALSAATRLLFMPDLFSFFLTGVSNNEYCIASTSELLDARRQTWNDELIGKWIACHLFGEIVMPGCVRRRSQIFHL